MPVVAVLRERIEIEPALVQRGVPGTINFYPSHDPRHDYALLRVHPDELRGDPCGWYRDRALLAARRRHSDIHRYWRGDPYAAFDAHEELCAWIEEEEKRRCRS